MIQYIYIYTTYICIYATIVYRYNLNLGQSWIFRNYSKIVFWYGIIYVHQGGIYFLQGIQDWPSDLTNVAFENQQCYGDVIALFSGNNENLRTIVGINHNRGVKTLHDCVGNIYCNIVH